MHGPQPSEIHPMKGFDQVCFINNVISNPNIIVGDYAYYDDPTGSECFTSGWVQRQTHLTAPFPAWVWACVSLNQSAL